MEDYREIDDSLAEKYSGEENKIAQEKVLKYLTERGISKDTIEKFNLGLAPPSYTTLYDNLKDKFANQQKLGVRFKGKQIPSFGIFVESWKSFGGPFRERKKYRGRY